MENIDRASTGTPRTAPVKEGHEHHEDSISGNSGTIAQGGKAELHDRTGLYLAIIAILFAAMAFGMSIVLPMIYQERTEALKDRVAQAEQTAALAREDIRVMQNALAARGIKTDIHEEQRK